MFATNSLTTEQVAPPAFIGLLLACSFFAGQASAEELPEIVVTAQKREVNLSDAGFSVSVLSGESFATSNVMKLDNFNAYVPGLVVAKNDGAGRVVTMRGLGWETAQNLVTQPSVLTYVDGVYLANPLALGLDIGELERVEVFRGPQGTEFGQGTTGGAINLVSRKPLLGELSGYADLAAGNYGLVRTRSAINIPMSESLAARLSLQTHKHNGYAEITGGQYDGYDLDDANSVALRAAMLWQPSNALSLHLNAFLYTSDQHAAAQKNVADPESDARELTQDFPGIFGLDNRSASLILSWAINDRLTFKAISGWQDLQKEQSVDGDRLTESLISIDRLGFFTADNWDVLTYWDNNSDAISQELNLRYSGAILDFSIGAYYLDHENFNDFLEATGAAPFANSVDALANPNPTTLPPFASVLNFNEARTVRRKDKAIYTQATWQMSEVLALTGGLRYQDEKQRDFGEQFFGLFGGFDRSTDDSALTYRAALQWTPNDEHLWFGSVSSGWKNGGSNPGAITNNALLLSEEFAAEEVTTFEVGSRNSLLDGRLQFDIVAFFNNHEHLQFVFEDPVPFAGGTGTIPNVAEYGVEIEAAWQPAAAWRIEFMLALQDGEIDSNVFVLDSIDFREALAPGTGLFTNAGFDVRVALANSTNLRGNTPAKLPAVMARLAAEHAKEFSDGTIVVRLEALHRGEMQARVFNHPLVDNVAAYTVTNLDVRFTLRRRPITFGLSATNLFDHDGINNVFSNPFGIWSTSREYIPPRQLIASIRYLWE